MRKLKHHEQKLLKKVRATLTLCHFSCHVQSFFTVIMPCVALSGLAGWFFQLQTRKVFARAWGHPPLPHPEARGLRQVRLQEEE
jgi:hypothetical protein